MTLAMRVLRRRRGGRDVVFVMLYAGPLLAARAGLAEGAAGGAETQILLLAQQLHRRGHRVAIATLDVEEGLPNDVDGVEVIALPRRPAGAARVAQLLWPLRFLVGLGSLDHCVVVQRGAGAITGLVAMLSRLCGRRFVYSSAGVIDFDYGRLERDAWARRLFGIGRRLAHGIVVQSDEQAVLCRGRWGRSSTVIRSLAEPAPQRTETPEAFLWIGRLVPYKRPELVLELARRVPRAQFRILGSASHKHPDVLEELRRGAAELPNVELLAPRPRAELGPLYDRAVAVLNTSKYEGMSNVLLEAWARGVPAIVLSHDPDGLVGREALGWRADGSMDKLSELAASVWDERDDQSAIAERCRAYLAREHAPARVAERWEPVLGLGEPRP